MKFLPLFLWLEKSAVNSSPLKISRFVIIINLLIILNDNAMGIDPSVGALKKYFTNVKAGKKVRKNNIIT